VSAIVGTLPIAIGVGTSAASRRPLGMAVVGGLAFSQIVTLYVTPVFYSYFDELQSWIGRKAPMRVATEAHPVPVAGD
jgi:HAE1 family hydrophobic/amphiphilic exporter-1